MRTLVAYNFLDVYESGGLTGPEKQVVMQLIIASYDAWLNELREADPVFKGKLREHLSANPDLKRKKAAEFGSLCFGSSLRN